MIIIMRIIPARRGTHGERPVGLGRHAGARAQSRTQQAALWERAVIAVCIYHNKQVLDPSGRIAWRTACISKDLNPPHK